MKCCRRVFSRVCPWGLLLQHSHGFGLFTPSDFLFQVYCCLYPPTVCLCDVVFMDFLSRPDSVLVCGSSLPFERLFCLFLEKPHSEISVHVTLDLLVVVATGLVAKDELVVLSHCGRSSAPATDAIRLWRRCTGRAG